jgi:hypothetical protein
MASLNNPVNLQNIIDRFADYVVVAANSGIAWGLDNKPFPEMDDYYFGGFTSGKSISIQGQGYQGTKIDASGIYIGLILETFRYSNIRNARVLLYVTSTDEQTGEYYEAPVGGGYVFDQTAKAHLSTNYTYGVDYNRLARGAAVAGNRITAAGLEDLFNRARSLYYEFLIEAAEITIFVCHASCHYSCHSSRTRR